jgi:hypothetical protein
MSSQQEKLQLIEQKVKTLMQKHATLEKAYEAQNRENEMMKQETVSQKEKIKELENQLNVLKLAKSVSSGNGNDSDRAELKRKINEMVKEIDMCVGLLNN